MKPRTCTREGTPTTIRCALPLTAALLGASCGLPSSSVVDKGTLGDNLLASFEGGACRVHAQEDLPYVVPCVAWQVSHGGTVNVRFVDILMACEYEGVGDQWSPVAERSHGGEVSLSVHWSYARVDGCLPCTHDFSFGLTDVASDADVRVVFRTKACAEADCPLATYGVTLPLHTTPTGSSCELQRQ